MEKGEGWEKIDREAISPSQRLSPRTHPKQNKERKEKTAEANRRIKQREDSLLTNKRRVLIRRITHHPIIHHIPRVRNRIAPKRLLLDPEGLDLRASDIAQREADRPSVPVLARARRVVAPPRLAVPVDAARAVRVDGVVGAGDDEPGGLALVLRVLCVVLATMEMCGRTWMKTTR